MVEIGTVSQLISANAFRAESTKFDFLAGGGEMGDRIRDYDWSEHPLGNLRHGRKA